MVFKRLRIMTNVATALEKEGISAIRFDFSANGESEGTFEYGNYKKEADDLHAVIQHFSGANRIISGILGHSKGGDVVLLYASRYYDIRTVVNVSERYDLKSGIAERMGEDFVERLNEKGYFDDKDKKECQLSCDPGKYDTTSKYQYAHGFSCDRQRLQAVNNPCMGRRDHSVEDTLEFAKIIPNHKLRIVEGANHRYSLHQAELASIVVDYIKEVLEQERPLLLRQ